MDPASLNGSASVPAEPIPASRTRANRVFVCTLLLILVSSAWARAQNPSVTITVDVNANRHPINPNIYGVAHATTAQLNDLNSPLNRNGGNNTTRYNWRLNADNRGNDWYYESIGESNATAGERGDTFLVNSRAANAQAMLTVPLIDWVANLLLGNADRHHGIQLGRGESHQRRDVAGRHLGHLRA